MFLVLLWGWGNNGLDIIDLLSISVSHVIVCLSIDTPLYWFGLGLLFTTAFSVYMGFWLKVAYIRRFLAKSRVHTQLFFKQLRTSSLLVEFDVVGSCWVGCECGWVLLGSDVVCWMLLL